MDTVSPQALDLDFLAKQSDANIAEAHRQRPPVIGAPCLILHIGVAPYKVLDPQDAKTPDDYNERLGVWVEDVNKTIRMLSALNEDKTATDIPQLRTEKQAGLLTVGTPIIEFAIYWQGLRILCLIEGHYDFVAFTLLVDITISNDKNPENKQLLDLLKNIEVAQTAEAEEQQHKQAAHYLLKHSGCVFRVAALINSQLTENDNLLPGQPFAKFFGLVLEEGADATDDRFDADDADANAQALVRKRWPFIIQANAGADPRDVVVSSMLSKRAIYITAMGAKPADEQWSTKPGQPRPHHYSDVQAVRYIIMIRPNPNTFELGRLIEHINSMGTFRLIALKELSVFRHIGTSLRLYGHLVDAASEKFNDLLTSEQSTHDDEDYPHLYFELGNNNGIIPVGAKGNPLTFIRDTKNIRRLQNILCQIQGQVFRESAHFTGGLNFRVSRTNFYVNSLKERIPDLDIRRIHPYQSYMGFIRRRLFSTFEHINDIGERSGRLSIRLSRLLEAIQSKALVDLTKNIENLNKAISDQTRAGEAQTQIIFFLTVFVALGQIIHPWFWTTFMNAGQGDEAEPNSALVTWMVVAVISLGATLIYGSSRWLKSERRKQKKRDQERERQKQLEAQKQPSQIPGRWG